MKEHKEKRVLTVGVFDFFHLGHLNVLEAAKEKGNYLIVAVHDDKLNTKGVEFLYSLEERMRFVRSIVFVDEVVPYERIDLLVENVDFDIFAYGADQNHEFFQKAFEWCRKNKKELVMLKRTEGISSTKLRGIIEKKEI